MPLEIPAPHTIFDVPLEDGARIRVRRHGNPEGVRLFLSHGNGYAINGYMPYWQHFLDRFDQELAQPEPRDQDAALIHLCVVGLRRHRITAAGQPRRRLGPLAAEADAC